MPDLERRIIPGSVESSGVEILPSRAGHDDRQRAKAHLAQMHTGGYIDDDQLAARYAAADLAVTKGQLNGLIEDLPGYPEPKSWAKQLDRPTWRWVMHGAWAILALAVAMIPGFAWGWSKRVGAGASTVEVFLVLAGAAILILDIVALCLWKSDY